MNSTSHDLTSRLPFLSTFSRESRESFTEGLTPTQFNIGQNICTASCIPNQVHFIESGTARLLGRNKGKLCTLATIGEGAVVGMASLLRVAGCEEIAAATPVKTLTLSDTKFLDFYREEKEFKNWCDNTLFIPEVAELLDFLLQHDESCTLGLQDLLGKAAAAARLEPPNQKQFPKDREIFIASSNCNLKIGTLVSSQTEVPLSNEPFPLRLISLPTNFISSNSGEKVNSNQEQTIDQSNSNSQNNYGQVVPTSLRLGQKKLQDRIDLIFGDGIVEETMACFGMLSQAMDLPYRRDAIEKTIRDALRRGQKPSLPMVGQLAASMGLHVVGAKVEVKNCTRLNTPCLMAWENTFALVVESNADGVILAHPRLGWLEVEPTDLQEKFPNELDLIFVDRTTATPEQKFNISWFWPALKRHKKTLIQVLLASSVVQLFTLANPLLIQVIIDKVISQRSLDTLQVLGIGLVIVTLFEGILGSLRTFLFVDTTNRIDMRLGAEVIDHLLRLPVGYFDRRPVGELGTRIAELEKIRTFLTGQALTTILDAAFSVIYILVMAMYSWILTIVALIVVPIQVALTLIGAPLFRRQFRQAAEENASTQAHLVEVLTGIQTVKAQNVEIVSRWKWQERYAKYVSRTFEKTVTGTALTQTGIALQKLSQLMVLWVGAAQVLSGNLTLGQLIAFRIISGYVTQPLLRLSNIWQSVQELRVSFERLADVVDTPEESSTADKAKIPLPPVAGEVVFENLNFRFKPSSPQVLKNINLKIESGKFVGIVGQSGSGKSTLMKLMPRLYSPESGRILIDNYDIDKVELYSLRRQIGIVPQEPLLFSGSVSENIALADPNATSESIVTAAKIACAHEFIMDLPEGYSTNLGERGANLSGGQRQRLAIARTLLANPKLLVMDEATSALDYDTEKRVCQNLRTSLKGCTVFFVTHRLPTIKNADKIIMMNKGAVVETGNHEELMSQKGRYFALYKQQESS